MNPADESVVIVDEHNQVVGAATRREMRAKRLIHRSTYILVFNSFNQLFLHKRSTSKDIYPGYCDPAVGGVVLAGEDYDKGARRELEEELGITAVNLTTLFDFHFSDGVAPVWGRAYSCMYDGEIILQREEIESGDFVEIEHVLERSETEPFTPDGIHVLRLYLDRNRETRNRRAPALG
jgi:isopentenyldiphosphate isomerase